jgi:hypothetical protein
MLDAMPGGFMLLYLSLGARLAPLLLMLSAILVGMRWLHDQPALAARRLNGVLAALWVIAGLVVAVPFAVRMGLIVGIRTAVDRRDFELAGARVEQYAFWGGPMEGNLVFVRGLARAREGRVAEAVPDFLAAARSNDPLVSRSMAVQYAALGEYALHRDAEAERLFLPLPDTPVRDYCLGRIAEHRGDPRSERWFRRSLALDPSFTPALYRLLRIVSMRHDVDDARRIVAEYRRRNPAESDAPYLREIVSAIERGEVLVDHDPYRFTL